MQKENESEVPTPRVDFVVGLLSRLHYLDAMRIKEIAKFFQDALVMLLDQDPFEDKQYREEWQADLLYLIELGEPCEGMDAEEIKNQISEALRRLEVKPAAHA